MGDVKESSAQTRLQARRLLQIIGYAIAPALAAGLLATSHLHDPGKGMIVFLSLLAISPLYARDRYPLHLMPFASAALRFLGPVAGVGLAYSLLGIAGSSVPLVDMIAPVAGAWTITLMAFWISLRFRSGRKVRIAVLGSSELASGLAHEIESARIGSYEVLGWLADRVPAELPADGMRWLGSLDDVREVVGRNSIELLVHCGPTGDGDAGHRSRLDLFELIASRCLDLPVRLIEATQLYEELLGHVPLGQSNSAWFQYMLHPRYHPVSPRGKRALDVIASAVMLTLLAPVLLVFSAIVKLTDGGPILYRQRRVGEMGREFEMIKLRSMALSSEDSGPQWSSEDDERVTGVGRIMRRLHIDEMPQLWNIFRGEMTLIGPRPERRQLIEMFERNIAYYDRRHLVKPGLAGWAQARCGYGGSQGGTSWKLCHDLYYLKHRSAFFDLLILLENFRVSVGWGVQFGLDAPQDQFILSSTGTTNFIDKWSAEVDEIGQPLVAGAAH